MTYVEVVEKKTGARMSHTFKDKIGPTSSTLFSAPEEAAQWMRDNGVPMTTHEVREAAR